MVMWDVIVIGRGIIGATVSKALLKQGRKVFVLDSDSSMSGTAPSGGHLKPSWFGSMPKSEYEPAMELLSEVWGLKEEIFKLWPLGRTTVYRVDTDLVRSSLAYSPAQVTSILVKEQYPVVYYRLLEDYYKQCEATTKLLVVATGAWAGELVDEVPTITRKQGISFRFSANLHMGLIKPWAPYKQIVAHQQKNNEVWIGDGTAIIDTNWTDLNEAKCEERCRTALIKATGVKSLNNPLKTAGIRPYCKLPPGEPCLLKQVGPSTWVATGAGKSGTIAAGWVARRLLNVQA